MGQWESVSPTGFFLPQSRPRVYGLFLKWKGISAKDMEERKADLATAMCLLKRLKVPATHEALDVVLRRCAAEAAGSSPGPSSAQGLKRKAKDNSDTGGPQDHKAKAPEPEAKAQHKWAEQHKKWAKKKGLTAADLARGADEFHAASSGVLHDRQREALWLRYVALRKRQPQLDWRAALLIANVGASVNFLSLRRDVFPCVTPHMAYAILSGGQLRLADGITIMAMQGIQAKEMRAFSFQSEKSNLLRDLGGNAFTANILAAFLMAGLSVM